MSEWVQDIGSIVRAMFARFNKKCADARYWIFSLVCPYTVYIKKKHFGKLVRADIFESLNKLSKWHLWTQNYKDMRLQKQQEQ